MTGSALSALDVDSRPKIIIRGEGSGERGAVPVRAVRPWRISPPKKKCSGMFEVFVFLTGFWPSVGGVLAGGPPKTTSF